METNPAQEAKYPDHLEPGQTPADIYPSWVDEKNIELKQNDIDHIPDVFNLLKIVNEYVKTPVYQLKQGEDYHKQFEEKSGDFHHDLILPKWLGIYPAYEKGKPFIARLILYYGRYVKPEPFEYDPKWPSKDTPYGLINYHILGYRGIEQFLSNYTRIRDYVVGALDYYFRNDPSRGDIVKILGRKVSDLTGNQYLALLKEDRRRIEYDKQLDDLY